MPSVVMCTAASDHRVEALLGGLKAIGILDLEMSLIVLDRPGVEDIVGPAQLRNVAASRQLQKPCEFSWNIRAGLMVLNGGKLAFAAGPLIAMLCATALRTESSGLPAALIAMGVPRSKVQKYESAFAAGRVLLAVRAPDASDAQLAREIMRRAQAEHIAVLGRPTSNRMTRVREK